METVQITKVAQLSDGRLGVFPEIARGIYQYVYREAAGVYWSDSLGCFHSNPPQDWSLPKWYLQILSVVRSGLGIRLRLAPSCNFDGDSESFRQDILDVDRTVQKWIDDTFPDER
jgi:hypothetical protein